MGAFKLVGKSLVELLYKHRLGFPKLDKHARRAYLNCLAALAYTLFSYSISLLYSF